MDKRSDQELIEAAEKHSAFLKTHRVAFATTKDVRLAIELAARLKSANALLDERLKQFAVLHGELRAATMESKTDAELIEEVRKWEPIGPAAMTEAVLLMHELAARLKATNEKLTKVAQEDEDMAGMPSTSPTLARLFKTRAEALRR